MVLEGEGLDNGLMGSWRQELDHGFDHHCHPFLIRALNSLGHHENRNYGEIGGELLEFFRRKILCQLFASHLVISWT